MNFQTMSKQRKFILIAAAVGLISMFLPWIDFLALSINGMHDKGIIVFFCFLVAGVLAFVGDQTKNLTNTPWFIVLICGTLATVLMIWFFMEGSDSYLGAPFAFGFYIAGLAAIG